MKINDLKRYKPLDITQLPGSPWNTAEKVLGLDENKDVVMAKPEGVVTPEDITSAITEAMEAETARTIMRTIRIAISFFIRETSSFSLHALIISSSPPLASFLFVLHARFRAQPRFLPDCFSAVFPPVMFLTSCRGTGNVQLWF